MTKRDRITGIVSVLFALINCLILIVTIIYCVLFFRGTFNLCIVTTDSLAPELKSGDVFCYEKPDERLSVGDIVIYESSDNHTIIQQIEGRTTIGSELYYLSTFQGEIISFAHSQVEGVYTRKSPIATTIYSLYSIPEGKIIVCMLSLTIIMTGVVLAKYSTKYEYSRIKKQNQAKLK